ncbi:hypothetical protein D9619_008752 [Psilocybe cf. subviscida]|uniref:SigF-like NTF2-like domain-containing protein n=1 Tax=Psilocybe cf. subviscida TaxID=2480587 RepID=A0A8H5BAC6_9AGAR|nr:hypothetical protein D9619_008752 [Psilocybe cf. subviscida]
MSQITSRSRCSRRSPLLTLCCSPPPRCLIMQSPSQEIQSVMELIHSAITPDIQKAAINKFFTSDAALRTPWYSVRAGILSREDILGIYQWYRTVSPVIDVHVEDSVYDRLHNIVYADVTILYHFRMTPWAPAGCRVMSRFTLRQELGLHYIAMQEDFLHPEDAASVCIPYLASFVRMFLSARTLSVNLWARIAQVFGIWRAAPGVDHIHIEEVMAAPVEPGVGEGKMKNRVKREAKRAIKRGKQRQQAEGDMFGSNEVLLQDKDFPWRVENVVQCESRSTAPKVTNKSRFGGPIPGSRFSAVCERGSPQSLLNHVVTGKGPYDD